MDLVVSLRQVQGTPSQHLGSMLPLVDELSSLGEIIVQKELLLSRLAAIQRPHKLVRLDLGVDL